MADRDGDPGASSPERVDGGEEFDELLDSLTGNGQSPVERPDLWSAVKRRGPIWAIVGVGAVAVVGSLALSWVALSRSSDSTSASDGSTEAVAAAAADDVENDGHHVSDIMAVLVGLGLDDVVVEQRGSVIHLSGSVAGAADREAAIGAAQALADDETVDASELAVQEDPQGEAGAAADPGISERAAAFQSEINRIVAVTPMIFDTGQSSLSELQLRILNNVATVMQAYPDLMVKVVGYTDGQGTDEANLQLSLARAGSVQSYLLAQGIPASQLDIAARGEETSSGSEALSSLERRVEFEVVDGEGVRLAPNDGLLRIAVVAPSPRNDLAFTQSMVDAVNVLAEERGNVEIDITDNTFVPAEAAVAIRNYAEEDYDLIIAHGVEFAGDLLQIVRDFPGVTFAWGTAIDTFGLPNLYAYDAAAEEGGYVMGNMGAMLSTSNQVGIVGPIEVGDAERYVNGFEAGASLHAYRPSVFVAYTGSFADIALAAEVANSHIASGADVLTGSAEMVVGAVAVAEENDVLWFGTQANQSSLAPSIVVASQVYHWEVVLRSIVTDIDAGTVNGRGQVIDLANGGLIIEHNPEFDLPDDVRRRADELIAEIVTGALTVPIR